jgi:DNA-binding CsgD family transcriptional regulator
MNQKILPFDRVEANPHRGDPVLVSSLPPQEHEVYLWLLNAYSMDWISESMGLEKRAIKTLAANVYRILKVSDQRELVRYYFVPANGSPVRPGEELAQSMAQYTEQCATRMNYEGKWL